MAASSEPEIENVEVIFGALTTRKLWMIKIDEERHEVGSITAITVQNAVVFSIQNKVTISAINLRLLLLWKQAKNHFSLQSERP